MEVRALLVGLSEIDASKYKWDGKAGCEGVPKDLINMTSVITKSGEITQDQITVLQNSAATAEAVLQKLTELSSELKAGDGLYFYYSGHGSSIPDRNGDEDDGRDETLITYNRPLVDDEIYNVLLKFAAGVRIVMISDSCHSGSNFQIRPYQHPPERKLARQQPLQASLIHLGACRDEQQAGGYLNGGAFTMAIKLLSDTGYEGTYANLIEHVSVYVRGAQDPQYLEAGPTTSPEFEAFRKQKIFTFSNLQAAPVLVPKSDAEPKPVIEVLPPKIETCLASFFRGCSSNQQFTKAAVDHEAPKPR